MLGNGAVAYINLDSVIRGIIFFFTAVTLSLHLIVKLSQRSTLRQSEKLITSYMRCCRGRMVVGFTTTCAVNAYHH